MEIDKNDLPHLPLVKLMKHLLTLTECFLFTLKHYTIFVSNTFFFGRLLWFDSSIEEIIDYKN